MSCRQRHLWVCIAGFLDTNDPVWVSEKYYEARKLELNKIVNLLKGRQLTAKLLEDGCVKDGFPLISIKRHKREEDRYLLEVYGEYPNLEQIKEHLKYLGRNGKQPVPNEVDKKKELRVSSLRWVRSPWLDYEEAGEALQELENAQIGKS